MNPDNPETLSLDESEWDETQMEDVFVPSVRVHLSWADVEAAVQRGEIVPAAAYGLWSHWASPGAPTRVRSEAALPAETDDAPATHSLQPPVANRAFAAPATKPDSPLVLVVLALGSALLGGVISTVVLLFGVR
jgi:hypothetical protein